MGGGRWGFDKLRQLWDLAGGDIISQDAQGERDAGISNQIVLFMEQTVVHPLSIHNKVSL